MAFDIYRLDGIDWESSNVEEVLVEYQEGLVERFFDSPEGQMRVRADPEMGFWAAQLIHCGYTYLGATLPQMTVAEFREILTEIFPRKISLLAPDDAEDAVPELAAFWEYLGREYHVPRAGAMLEFLREIECEFPEIMNDPSNFGMAKSFFMAGQSAGFDMVNEADMHAFMLQYNAQLMQERTRRPGFIGEILSGQEANRHKENAKQKRQKRKRKAAATARKRNRRKRK